MGRSADDADRVLHETPGYVVPRSGGHSRQGTGGRPRRRGEDLCGHVIHASAGDGTTRACAE